MIFTAYIDGAARGNPGPAGSGAYVVSHQGRDPEEHFEALGRATNNVAEYRALLLALDRARVLGATEVRIFSDSLLLVEQMNGRYKVRADHLRPLWEQARRSARTFSRFSVAHIPRERNMQADRLANLGADESERMERTSGGGGEHTPQPPGRP
jgi:ribonuclease HI